MTGFSTGLVVSHQDIGLKRCLDGFWSFQDRMVLRKDGGRFSRRIGRVFVRIGLRFFPGLDRPSKDLDYWFVRRIGSLSTGLGLVIRRIGDLS